MSRDNKNWQDICLEAVLEAGNLIKHLNNSGKEWLKRDIYVGHHAIVTDSDMKSQSAILKMILNKVNDAHFIAEDKIRQKSLSKRILTERNYLNHILENVFIVDPLDGTSQNRTGLYEWSVSVGLMKNMEHLAGTVYAPDIRGGLILCGAKNHGAFEIKDELHVPVKVAENKQDSKKMFYLGVDTFLMPEFNKFVYEVSKRVRTTNSVGSCALGLDSVARGNIDLLLQPPQRVWDWGGAYPIVMEAGGEVRFYKMSDRSIIPINKLKCEDYNPEKKEIGFLAGNPENVDKFFDLLVKLYNK